MPEIGEIKYARDIANRVYSKNTLGRLFIYKACMICGKERWVHLIKGVPEATNCAPCTFRGMRDSKHPYWKGDEVSLPPLHIWVKRRLPKPKCCEICKKAPPYDLACKGEYNRDLKNWYWICRRCHMLSDGRMIKLKQFVGQVRVKKT